MITILSIFMVAAVGHCALVDDFNDGSMNTSMWTLFIDGIGPTTVEVPGCVEVTIPMDAHEASPHSSFGGGFKSAKCVRGDFDIQVDYALTEWPPASGVRVGLGLFPAHTGNLASIQRNSFSASDNGPIEAYATDYSTGVGGGVPTNHTSGGLRLARIGNMLTAGVLVDGEWVELYSAEFSTDDYYIAFTAWSHDYTFSHQPVEVEFDNFVMRYGQLVDPSAPPVASANAPAQNFQQSAPRAVRSYAGKAATFRQAGVIVMPHGRSFLRLPRIVPKSVAPSVGPYARIMIALPAQKPGCRPQNFSFRRK